MRLFGRTSVPRTIAAAAVALAVALAATTNGLAQDAVSATVFEVDVDRAAVRQQVRSLLELPVGEESWIGQRVLGGYGDGGIGAVYPTGIFCVDEGRLRIFGGQDAPSSASSVLDYDYESERYLARRIDDYSVQLAQLQWAYNEIAQLADAMSNPCENTPFDPDTLLDVHSIAVLDKESFLVAQTFDSLSQLLEFVAEQEGH